MAGSQIERALGLLEQLAQAPQGVPMQHLVDALGIPKSAVHRMLAELMRLGYVRQDSRSSHYRLSTRLIALAFRYLAESRADIVQPVLDQLAAETGELVRLGIIEDDARLTWIAKSQGATSGLRYDPDMGQEAPLAFTASGQAWLASMDDAQALLRCRQQSLEGRTGGPNAPASEPDLLQQLSRARSQGYAWVSESSSVGTAALAAVVAHPDRSGVLGVLSIAGPSARLTEVRIHQLAPRLLQACEEISAASRASEFFG